MRKNAKWTMLLTYLSFVLVLVLAGNASAGPSSYDKEWDKGAADTNDWNAPLNWNPNGVPTTKFSGGAADQSAVINIADANCDINSTMAAVCYGLDVATDQRCYLNMSGGTLTTPPGLAIAIGGGGGQGQGTVDGNGFFNMTGGTVNCGGRLWVGYGYKYAGSPDPTPSYGTCKLNGGTFNVTGDKIELGKNPEGICTVDVNGGKLEAGNATCDLELGKYGTATLNIISGEVNVGDTLKLGEVTGTAAINLSGGTLTVGNSNVTAGEGSYINISNAGKMTVLGGRAQIDVLYGQGRIIAWDDDGIVVINEANAITTVTALPPDPNRAYKPAPRNYAKAEWTAAPTLGWKKATGLSSPKHDVYFGTDFTDVNNANKSTVGIFKGSQDTDANSYPLSPLGPLVVGQTYYWRIDENDACTPEPNSWKGFVWRFTINDYFNVESFDSYKRPDAPLGNAALKKVWSGVPAEGLPAISIEDTGNPALTIHSVGASAGRSMKYEYANFQDPGPYYTEVNANTTGPNSLKAISDWTAADIKALTLYFYGREDNNSAEPMYVALRSTDGNLAVVYYGADSNNDPNNLKIADWHEWNIKLSAFKKPSNVNDVNLQSIAQVYIGFGNRENPAKGSNGTIFFDDIRLYLTRCVAQFAPAGDVDGDCAVDYYDVDAMATDWLQRDSIRKGSDANLKGGATWVNDATQGPDGGPRGWCVQLDGINDWIDIDDSDFSDFRNKTIAFWVRVTSFPDVRPYMFYFNNDDEVNPYRIYFMTYYSPLERVRFMEGYGPSSGGFSAGTGKWHLLVFVLADSAAGATGTFYADVTGTMTKIGATLTGPRHSGAATGVNLGSSDDGSINFVNARFDDFRVYDHDLNLPEVQALYNATKAQNPFGSEPDANMMLHYTFHEGSTGGGTIAHNSSTYPFVHPLLSNAELYAGEAQGSRVVNFRDFAILAGSWLDEVVWPLP